MSWPRLQQEAKACKLMLVVNINEGLVLFKLADTVLILINIGPNNVKLTSGFGSLSNESFRKIA